MDPKNYWDSLDTKGRKRWAKRAGTNIAYLSQIVYGHRRASTDMAKALHEASDKQVPLSKLRPDIWEEAEAAA
jgi:DNA-binding transcriptional regulator YdaS (Cro superfamily)